MKTKQHNIDNLPEFKASSWKSWERYRSPFYRYWRIAFNSHLIHTYNYLIFGKLNEPRPITELLTDLYNEVAFKFAKVTFENRGQVKSNPVILYLFANADTIGRKIFVSQEIGSEFIGFEVVIGGFKRRTITSVNGFEITVNESVQVFTGDSVQVLKYEFDSFLTLFVANSISNYIAIKLLQRVQELGRTTQKDIEKLNNNIRIMRSEGITEQEISRYAEQEITKRANVRAKAIAITEVAQASNLGANISARLQLRTKKRWITMQDDRVRDNHYLMEAKTIGINEIFQVPNSLGGVDLFRFPLDQEYTPSAENVVNCRCGVIYE